ncbi:hypothetical protein M9434_000305 [Picochlorum sp. BPE23]|nr:hypothetical protein M9434_000305 [Picochlorum sp. BPE23]
MNNNDQGVRDGYYASNMNDQNVHGLFHGLNLGQQQFDSVGDHHHSGNGGHYQGNHGGHYQQFPPTSFGLAQRSGSIGNPVQPILDLADGGVATEVPLAGNVNPYQAAASFPHHHMNFMQYSAAGLDLHHGQDVPGMFQGGHGSTAPSLVGFESHGMPHQSHMGWGGQAIEDTHHGQKAMWFGKGQPQNRHYQNGNGNRRGRYRGKSQGRGGTRNFSRQRSGTYDGSSDSSDVSIDDILMTVSQTPEHESVGSNVFDSLLSLDSRAVASLLKELLRMGLAARAVEIFDRIRTSDPNSPLSLSLLDVFTYTAAISLCISTQDVDRALSLASEMKQKKIQCNVHTYTALMNVCIKCSRYGRALETYEAMRADGCVPNVVTFNTLIDVYGKTGAWEQAIQVLDTMRREGVNPVLRTYNTLLIACNMCNQPREAISAYKRMLEEGFTPNSTTYNALISAYGKCGQLDRVMEVFQEMTSRGCEKNVITFSSLISACEKAGQWQLALDLFKEMRRERCNPNTVTFNSLITALGQGGQWEKALQIFDQMKSRNCTPDVVTYTALISAMEKGGQWRLALESFERMKRQGCKADAIVYNAVVNALWETGIVWAQKHALRVFKQAVSEGHFPQQTLVPGLLRAEVNLHATTSGVAMLSLYEWLQNLQHFIQEYGEGSVPSKVTIVTDRGRGAREQGNLVVKEAVTAMMMHWKSPFMLSGQRHYAGSPSLEATGADLAAWVISESFDKGIHSFFSCSNHGATEELDDPGEQVEKEVQERCSAAFAAVKHFEKTHSLSVQNMGYLYLQMRADLVQNCIKINTELGGPEESVQDAVLLMDRVMSTSLNFASEVFDLLAAACVLIAYNQLESSSPLEKCDNAQVEKAAGLPMWAIKRMEWSILQVLGQDTASISSIRCVKLFMERLGTEQLPKAAADALMGDAKGLCLDCVSDTAFLNCRPSITAAAVIYVDRRNRGIIPFWPSSLAKLSGYTDVSALELSIAIKSAQRICGSRSQDLENEFDDLHQSVEVSQPSIKYSSSETYLLPQDGGDVTAPQSTVANISADRQAILESLQQMVARSVGPNTPEDTDVSAQGGSSGDQCSTNPSSNNENSSSGQSSEDGKA